MRWPVSIFEAIGVGYVVFCTAFTTVLIMWCTVLGARQVRRKLEPEAK